MASIEVGPFVPFALWDKDKMTVCWEDVPDYTEQYGDNIALRFTMDRSRVVGVTIYRPRSYDEKEG